MSTYVEYIEDNDGNLVDIYYYCSAVCANSKADRTFGVAERDTCTFCHTCKDMMAHGLQCPTWADPNSNCNGGME